MQRQSQRQGKRQIQSQTEKYRERYGYIQMRDVYRESGERWASRSGFFFSLRNCTTAEEERNRGGETQKETVYRKTTRDSNTVGQTNESITPKEHQSEQGIHRNMLKQSANTTADAKKQTSTTR